MTKKRFIKLLMAHGVRRNVAAAAAWVYNIYNIPYARAYQLHTDKQLKVFKEYNIDCFKIEVEQ